jgi:hypothetical protein
VQVQVRVVAVLAPVVVARKQVRVVVPAPVVVVRKQVLPLVQALAPVVVVRKQVRVVAVLAPVVVARKQVRVVVPAPVAAACKQVQVVAVLAPVPRWVLAQVQLLWVQAGLPLVLRKLVALLSRAVALAQPDAGCVLAQDVLVQQYDAPARLE